MRITLGISFLYFAAMNLRTMPGHDAMTRRNTSWITYIAVFSVLNLVFFVEYSYGDDKHHSRHKRGTSGGNDNDPNVALEGQCIVVCDADVVAGRPEIRDPPAPPVEAPRNGPVNNFWDRMQSAACGGLVNVGRRTRKVAFFAKRTTELATPSTPENGVTTVTFDHVIVNVGNGFNTEKSTFVVPVSGVYALSFQVYRIYNKNSLTIDLNVNGNPMLRGVADGDIANHNSAHNSGLLHLAARDRVSLQMSNGNLDSGWKYSTFSGYLIFEDDDI